jgi:hypothetical protein
MMVITSLLLPEKPTVARGEAKDKTLVSRGIINVSAPEYPDNKYFIIPSILLLLFITSTIDCWDRDIQSLMRIVIEECNGESVETAMASSSS